MTVTFTSHWINQTFVVFQFVLAKDIVVVIFCVYQNLSDEDLIAFFFNSVDTVICKKMSHFIYEASLRRDDLLIRNL